ncbi:DUF3800 domain-containing protein [Luteithermobacter gelatinilyticus]|uniref:DUF3800 domain-containing protein n=1 Tax=Luteithermobacter gelatinilyticus TaxID=2582913 RepID=UPI001105A993|nr:DUF3800 domain-containing protein [Luteithermobacter gelatinilyticus]
MSNYADYVVFADESGDHGLDGIDKGFPMFCLSFCLIKKQDYVSTVVPAFQQLKFDFWGHDGIVLHEREIRKSKGPFAVLRANPELRQHFYGRMNTLMVDAPMHISASVIRKHNLIEKYKTPWNPYEIALYFCMERLLSRLLAEKQHGKLVHVLFESRGNREDAELEIEFRRICANRNNWGYKQSDFTQIQFEPVFVSKAANATGLQLADLTARPIALHYLRPEQANRAYDLIAPKLYGVKSFP